MAWNGHRLSIARGALNLSQDTFAARIGASVTSLRNWEKGRSTPGFEATAAICAATRKPIEYFSTKEGS